MHDDKKHSNVLPDTLEEIQAFVDAGFESPPSTKTFEEIMDTVIERRLKQAEDTKKLA